MTVVWTNRDLSPIVRQGYWLGCVVSCLTANQGICSLNVHISTYWCWCHFSADRGQCSDDRRRCVTVAPARTRQLQNRAKARLTPRLASLLPARNFEMFKGSTHGQTRFVYVWTFRHSFRKKTNTGCLLTEWMSEEKNNVDWRT
jgi:hypothetical protein